MTTPNTGIQETPNEQQIINEIIELLTRLIKTPEELETIGPEILEKMRQLKQDTKLIEQVWEIFAQIGHIEDPAHKANLQKTLWKDLMGIIVALKDLNSAQIDNYLKTNVLFMIGKIKNATRDILHASATEDIFCY